MWYDGCDKTCVCEDAKTGFFRCSDRYIYVNLKGGGGVGVRGGGMTRHCYNMTYGCINLRQRSLFARSTGFLCAKVKQCLKFIPLIFSHYNFFGFNFYAFFCK
jgi:hypothetical protein